MLKANLEKVNSVNDEYLSQIANVAKAELAREGVEITVANVENPQTGETEEEMKKNEEKKEEEKFVCPNPGGRVYFSGVFIFNNWITLLYEEYFDSFDAVYVKFVSSPTYKSAFSS